MAKGNATPGLSNLSMMHNAPMFGGARPMPGAISGAQGMMGGGMPQMPMGPSPGAMQGMISRGGIMGPQRGMGMAAGNPMGGNAMGGEMMGGAMPPPQQPIPQQPIMSPSQPIHQMGMAPTNITDLLNRFSNTGVANRSL